ncbi:MAG: zf-HC2 domain-containing protein [Spirochaetes bacterium]|nr:zf-HC2 domain-containing protein [Spirochaetota bacterium]
MNCKDLMAQLDKYIDNELSDKEMKEMKMHLSSCEECRAELKSLRELKKELQSLGTVKAPADFLLQLNERINRRESRSILKKILFPLKIKLPVEAAGLLAAAAVVVLFFLPGKDFKEAVPLMQKSAYEIAEEEAGKPETRIAEVKSPESAAERSTDLYVPPKAEKEKPRAAADSGDEGLVIDQTYELVMIPEKPYGPERESVISEEMDRDYRAAGSAPAGSLSKRKAAAPAAAYEAEELPEEKRISAAPEKNFAESTKSEAVSDLINKSAESYKADNKQTAAYSIEEAVKKIKAAAESVRGVILSTGTAGKDKYINYVTVEIPAENNDEFLERVSALGKIKNSAEKKKDTGSLKKIRYKINISFQQ